MKLPGHDEAKRLGYTLYSTNGDRSRATYMKEDRSVFLTVREAKGGEGETAMLEATHKMVQLQIGPFSFPHQNIALFEAQLCECLPRGGKLP